MGGRVACPFAARWPERVRGLVFIESGLPGFGQEEAMNVAAGGSWHFGFNRAGDIAEALVRGREHLFIRHMIHRETVGVFDPTTIGEADVAVYAASAAAALVQRLVRLGRCVSGRVKGSGRCRNSGGGTSAAT